jgi:hypothetical protein
MHRREDELVQAIRGARYLDEELPAIVADGEDATADVHIIPALVELSQADHAALHRWVKAL